VEPFLRYVIGQLVEHPDDVIITETESEGVLRIHVAMSKSDLGRIIGRGGHTIQALRTLLSAAGEKRGVKVFLSLPE